MQWTATARRQGGLITRGQLRALGTAARTIDDWLRVGRLETTDAVSVYRVAGSAPTEHAAAWFAALATRSPLSYTSAAAWWEMSADLDKSVHVTRFDRRRLDWPDGVRVHRVQLARRDIVRHRGLWVTNRTVTALDCVGWLPLVRATAFADRAVQQGWLSSDDIARRLDQQPGRWGNRQLRRIGATLTRGIEAESERRLHALLRQAGITGWSPQLAVLTPAGSFRIDVAFPGRRLAIEVDGFAYHSAEGSFQRDRTRQNALIAAGWHVLRFTWADLVDRPEYVLAQITTLLAA